MSDAGGGHLRMKVRRQCTGHFKGQAHSACSRAGDFVASVMHQQGLGPKVCAAVAEGRCWARHLPWGRLGNWKRLEPERVYQGRLPGGCRQEGNHSWRLGSCEAGAGT